MLDESEIYVKELSHTIINLYKLVIEDMGYDMGDTNNEIEYRNYLVDDPVKFTEPFSADELSTGDGYSIGGPPTVSTMISSGQTKANALKVISMLISDLGLTKAQAAGIAGVMTAESGINPGIVNSGEKRGTYKSSSANNEGTPYGTKHSPWSYGAGICQWTFCDRKEKAIMGGLGVSKQEAIHIIKTKGIEGLSLEQQIKMLEYELNTSYKYTLDGLKKCTTAAQAAATFYCHAVAGYSTSTEPATNAEIAKKNAAYSKVGANSQINKGMSYAQGYMI